MNLKRLNNLSKTGLSALFCFLLLPLFAGDLKIGSAAVKITPPVGIPMAGQYFDRRAEGIHDDLYAKAIVINQGNSKIAIVSCDLVEVTADLVHHVRELAEKMTGIPGDHIMVSATHTHTGPVVLSPTNIYTLNGKPGELLSTYMADLPGLVALSIKQANENAGPAVISFGSGHEETVSFNRRFFMKDGTVGWNPGKLNPGIIKPAGPIDPEVGVLYAETADNKPIATYVNFALHLDITTGLEISADLPFTLATILGNIKGREMVTLFGQGCSGNINHIDVKSSKSQDGHAEAQRIGTVLAGEVIKTYTRMISMEVDHIGAKSEIVRLPLAEVSADSLPHARAIAAQFGKDDATPFMEMVNAYKVIDVYERHGRPLDAEVQVFTLGSDLAVVGLPGEIFTELGMNIKSRSPYAHTIVVELANSSIDYIPDRKAFAEGNYEAVSARCLPGSGEILVEKALEILNKLKDN